MRNGMFAKLAIAITAIIAGIGASVTTAMAQTAQLVDIGAIITPYVQLAKDYIIAYQTSLAGILILAAMGFFILSKIKR